MAPEELPFEFLFFSFFFFFPSEAAVETERETSFAFVKLIHSLAGSLKPAAPLKKKKKERKKGGWDNTISAIQGGPAVSW